MWGTVETCSNPGLVSYFHFRINTLEEDKNPPLLGPHVDKIARLFSFFGISWEPIKEKKSDEKITNNHFTMFPENLC